MASLKFRIQTDNLLSDRLLFFITIFCFLCILGQTSLILTATEKLPPQIPLFYSKPWGEQMLAPSFFIWILPITTLTLFVINFLISKLLQNLFLIRSLFITSAVIAIFVLYNTTKIISLLT